MSGKRNAYPTSWATSRIASLLREPLRNGHSARENKADGIRTLTLTAVTKRDFGEHNTKLTSADPRTVADLWLQPDDILIQRSNTPELVGTAALYAGPPRYAIFPDLLIRVRLHAEFSPRFVEGFLRSNSARHYFRTAAQGIAGSMPKISQGVIEALEVPLPPLPEQHRIVDALESYFTRLDDAVATLERVQRNLKRYRASVLKAAVEGRLVPTEAELARAEGRDYEPASVLLERILKERRRRWEQAGGRGKYKEPVAPDTRNLPELPEGWCWASPDQLAAAERNSLGIGPFGSNLKVSDYLDVGVPLIFVRSIRSETFGGPGTKFVSCAKAEELSAHVAKGGDVLITKMGDPPGDSCLYPRGQPDAVITADCIKWRLHGSLTASGFFVHALRSSVVRSQILGITKGVAQKKVSLARFQTTGIPLPPLDEQQRIEQAIERLLSVATAVANDLLRTGHRCTRLRQSILKWAFEGKLVDQDPNDEPASVLLERIRAERQATGVAHERSRKRGPKRSTKARAP